MILHRAFISTFIATFVALFTFTGAALAQGQAPWTVTTLDGDVKRSQDGGAPVALAVGDSIGVGSKVTTGANARVVLTRGTERMTLSLKGEIAIPEEIGGLLTRIVQNLGTLLLDVDKKPNQHFEVKTPYLAAVVKGTTFRVNFDQTGGAVHVLSGLVQVTDPVTGQSGLVRPGRTGVVPATGGGLKISSTGAEKRTQHAKAKADNDNSGGETHGQERADERKSDKAKSAKGLTIKATLGVTKINIAAVTKGFMKADGATGINAGAPV